MVFSVSNGRYRCLGLNLCRGLNLIRPSIRMLDKKKLKETINSVCIHLSLELGDHLACLKRLVY